MISSRDYTWISVSLVDGKEDAYLSLLDVELVAHIFVLGPFVDLILSVAIQLLVYGCTYHLAGVGDDRDFSYGG